MRHSSEREECDQLECAEKGVLKRNSADALAQKGLDYQTKALGLLPSDTQS